MKHHQVFGPGTFSMDHVLPHSASDPYPVLSQLYAQEVSKEKWRLDQAKILAYYWNHRGLHERNDRNPA